MKAEIEYRRANGAPEYTITGLNAALRALGYRLDRSMDCRSTATWQTGPRAGCSYSVTTLYIREIDSGLGAFNVNARRDSNFEELQKMRGIGAFVIGTRAILEI